MGTLKNAKKVVDRVGITEEDLLLGYKNSKWSTPELKVPEESENGAISFVRRVAFLLDEVNNSVEDQIARMSWEGGRAPM